MKRYLNAGRPGPADPRLQALGWRFREADKDVEVKVFPAQELDLLAFDDLDPAMAA